VTVAFFVVPSFLRVGLHNLKIIDVDLPRDAWRQDRRGQRMVRR